MAAARLPGLRRGLQHHMGQYVGPRLCFLPLLRLGRVFDHLDLR